MTEQETRYETNISTRRAGLAHDSVRTSDISSSGKSLSRSPKTLPKGYNQDVLLFPLTSLPPISDSGPSDNLPRHRLLPRPTVRLPRHIIASPTNITFTGCKPYTGSPGSLPTGVSDGGAPALNMRRRREPTECAPLRGWVFIRFATRGKTAGS